jgi:hypothetical protein
LRVHVATLSTPNDTQKLERVHTLSESEGSPYRMLSIRGISHRYDVPTDALDLSNIKKRFQNDLEGVARAGAEDEAARIPGVG